MTFLKSRRSQFIAWMVIYALAVALMASKSGDEGWFFVWGLALGVGAGIATCIPGPQTRWARLGIVAAWLVAGWLVAFPLLWDHLGSTNTSLPKRVEHATYMTLICGFPALLALTLWIFRRPKLP